MWPRPPVRVERATTRGRLHDLGSYPALVEGSDLVTGELWHLKPEDLEVTLEALDRVECYGIDDVDLYERRVIECQTQDGLVLAYAYLFANPAELTNVSVIQPGPDGCCRWPAITDDSDQPAG